MMITMSASYDPGDLQSESTTDGSPPEPRVTLGVVMFVTALIPIVGVQYLSPELAGKLLTAMIPLLLFAVLRTSITPYTVFESFGPSR